MRREGREGRREGGREGRREGRERRREGREGGNGDTYNVHVYTMSWAPDIIITTYMYMHMNINIHVCLH